MAADDILVLSDHFTFQGNPNQFTWCFKVTTPDGIDPDVQALAENFESGEHQALLPMMDDSVQFDCIQVREIHPATTLPFEIITNEAGTRAVVTDPLPGQCSMLVQLLPATGDPTPRRRGRDFVTGRDTIDHLDGIWNQAGADVVLTFYTGQFSGPVTTPNGGEYHMGVWSPVQLIENNDPQFVSNGGSVPDPPTFGNDPFSILDTFRVRSRVRTQRRRQPEAICGQFLTFTPP